MNWPKLFSYGEVICFVSAWAVTLLMAVSAQRPADDRAVPGPEGAGRHHEVAVAELEEARTGQAREHGQEGDTDRDHGDGEGGPEHRGEQERGEDGREALDGVDQPHEALVRPAAEVAREHAEGHPHQHADAHRDDADQDRRDRAPHHAREQIAPELIRAQRVRQGRTLQAGRDGHLQRVAGRVDQAHRGGGDQGQGDDEADHERDVPAGVATHG